jgi:chromosome segregation ATPase
MKRRNDELEEENHSLRLRGEALEKDIRAASTAVEEQESAKVKLKTLAAEFEADYVMMRSKVDTLTKEKSGLEVRIAMLEAAKASYEYKSDRILERDNAIVVQHDRLKSDFNEQAKKVVYLQQQVAELSLALKRLDAEKKQLSEEDLTLRETIKTLRMRLRTRNGPSPRPSFGGPGKNAKTMSAFFRSRQ